MYIYIYIVLTSPSVRRLRSQLPAFYSLRLFQSVWLKWLVHKKTKLFVDFNSATLPALNSYLVDSYSYRICVRLFAVTDKICASDGKLQRDAPDLLCRFPLYEGTNNINNLHGCETPALRLRISIN